MEEILELVIFRPPHVPLCFSLRCGSWFSGDVLVFNSLHQLMHTCVMDRLLFWVFGALRVSVFLRCDSPAKLAPSVLWLRCSRRLCDFGAELEDLKKEHM